MRRTWCGRAQAILARGGAARANVFTRITLALFGQVPWRARALHPGRDHAAAALVSVPPGQGVVLVAHRDGAAVHPVHANARAPRIRAASDVAELFVTPPEQERHYFPLPQGPRALAGARVPACSIAARARIDPLIPQAHARARATRRAEAWILERLNGEDGLGAIFPAMVNALEALAAARLPRG